MRTGITSAPFPGTRTFWPAGRALPGPHPSPRPAHAKCQRTEDSERGLFGATPPGLHRLPLQETGPGKGCGHSRAGKTSEKAHLAGRHTEARQGRKLVRLHETNGECQAEQGLGHNETVCALGAGPPPGRAPCEDSAEPRLSGRGSGMIGNREILSRDLVGRHLLTPGRLLSCQHSPPKFLSNAFGCQVLRAPFPFHNEHGINRKPLKVSHSLIKTKTGPDPAHISTNPERGKWGAALPNPCI